MRARPGPPAAAEIEFAEVHFSGERRPVSITHSDATEYATRAAEAFGVGESRTVPFDPERARTEAKGEEKKKGGRGTKS